MDLDAGLAHTSLGDIPRPEIMSAQVQLMCQSVMDHDLETGIQKDLHGGMDRRITFLDKYGLLLLKFLMMPHVLTSKKIPAK